MKRKKNIEITAGILFKKKNNEALFKYSKMNNTVTVEFFNLIVLDGCYLIFN